MGDQDGEGTVFRSDRMPRALRAKTRCHQACACVGLGPWSVPLSQRSFSRAESIGQLGLGPIALFWLQPLSPVLFHQRAGRLPGTVASWLPHSCPSGPSPSCRAGRGEGKLPVDKVSFPFPGLQSRPKCSRPLIGVRIEPAAAHGEK